MSKSSTKEILVRPTGKNVPLESLVVQALEIDMQCMDFMVKSANLQTVRFNPDSLTLSIVNEDKSVSKWGMTRFSMGQLCNKLGVPIRYIDRCIDEGMSHLAEDNINSWLDEFNKPLFVRTYNDTIRGILSDRYMVMDTYDVLSVIDDVLNPNDYTVKGYYISPDRFHARIVQKDMMKVYGEDLYAGLQIDSSDVGRSVLSVQFFVYKQVCTNGLCVPKLGGTLFKQRHLGGSDPYKSLTEFRESFKESITKIPDLVSSTREVIDSASKSKKPFLTDSSMSESQLEEVISKVRLDTNVSEDSAKKIIELVQNKYKNNTWGYVNAITEVAQDFSLERRLELEQIAGNLLVA